MKKRRCKGLTKRMLGWLLAGLLLLSAAGAEEGAWRLRPMAGEITPGRVAVIYFTAPEAGACDLVVRDEAGNAVSVVCLGFEAIAGDNSVHWNGTHEWVPVPEGTWRLCLERGALLDEVPVTVGRPAEPEETAEAPEDTQAPEETPAEPEAELEEEPMPQEQAADRETKDAFTPAHTSPFEGRDASLNYWTLPMDITDEAAVWKALTAPITVIDNGKTEKAQIVLRSAPAQDSEGVGTVTCMTQGVHVLERGEEWSLVECYSSSFYDSPVLNWNALVQGYVLTEYLTEITPNQELGYVVDKLTQRLYVFVEGKLYSTLLVSTGLSNKRQPYNETRSGEFLMTSKVGTFASDNLKCGLAIRFNKGDLLHEVPHILQADGTRNYKNCEPKLGTKASHGCIRVQRKRTPENVNMSWIWEHHSNNTRMFIWEDWQGRQIPYPAEDHPLYYNPKGGVYYHSADHCSSVQRKDIVFEAFPYAELDREPYAELKWCEYCAPALRKAEIDKINAVYAPGGDHDPVITEARKTCPRPLK